MNTGVAVAYPFSEGDSFVHHFYSCITKDSDTDDVESISQINIKFSVDK